MREYTQSSSDVAPPRVSKFKLGFRVGSRLSTRQSVFFALPWQRRSSESGFKTPRLGTIGAEVAVRASTATAMASLSYNSRSWVTTFRLLDLRSEDAFVLKPWLVLTIIAFALPGVCTPPVSTRLWPAY